MKDHVSPEVKRARLDEMLALARDSAADYRRCYLGRTMVVLWEEQTKAPGERLPAWEGLTDNYIRVFTHSGADLRNRLLPVRLTAEEPTGMAGELFDMAMP